MLKDKCCKFCDKQLFLELITSFSKIYENRIFVRKKIGSLEKIGKTGVLGSLHKLRLVDQATDSRAPVPTN